MLDSLNVVLLRFRAISLPAVQSIHFRSCLLRYKTGQTHCVRYQTRHDLYTGPLTWHKNQACHIEYLQFLGCTIIYHTVLNHANKKKAGNLRTAFEKPLLPWKSIVLHIWVRAGGVRGVPGGGGRGGAWARLALLIQYATPRRPTVCNLWLHIFRHYFINGTIFGKKLRNVKRMFWFSLQLLFETFLILKRNMRDIVINVKTTSCKVPVTLTGF
jgi:hypothetical protein